MRQYQWLPIVFVAAVIAACSRPANIEQERTALLAADSEWSQTTTDIDKFMSFFTSDASIYPPGMAVTTGPGPIREAFTKMSSAPGFALKWTPTKAEIAAAGDIGYTTGTYEATMAGGTEQGKYVTVWKKQSDGTWKVAEDIFNADASPQSKPAEHVTLQPSALTWGEPPPGLPRGAKLTVLAGDPSKAGSFVIRAQFPAGYKIPPHWHPTDENVTVISGVMALGMGDTFDQASMKELPAGGYAVLPADMRHFAMTKTGAIVQLHGMGPFAINYVNPADDPRQQGK